MELTAFTLFTTLAVLYSPIYIFLWFMYRKIVCVEFYIIAAVSVVNTPKYYTIISKEIEEIHRGNVRRRLVNIMNNNARTRVNIGVLSTSECMKMYYKYRIRSCVDGIVEQLYTWHGNDDYRADSLNDVPEYEYIVGALADRLIALKN